jgi:hypothetical protein
MSPTLAAIPEATDAVSNARTSRRPFAAFYDRYERAIAGYFMRRTRDPESDGRPDGGSVRCGLRRRRSLPPRRKGLAQLRRDVKEGS